MIGPVPPADTNSPAVVFKPRSGRRGFMARARMADELRRKLTIFDAMILVAAAAVGVWGAAAYRAFPLPVVSPPPAWLPPLLMSVPITAALTVGFLVIPMRTLRERTRRVSRQPGTALCLTAAAALLGVLVRWTLRAWMVPFADGSLWIYGAEVLIESAKWCGLGVGAALPLLFLGGRLRRQVRGIEWVRLALAAYWLTVFLIFSALI